MALNEYRAKRDFRKTREPSAGRVGKTAPGEPSFVVQEHHASHLHYDFRLEADGVLKSWAVPKQPTLDPTRKRLAVQVEDHPLAYARFEGTIPEGEYGAGQVILWDRGTYQNLMADKPHPQTVGEAIAAGHLEFLLHGEKLRGKFALIRMKNQGRGKPQWLLIKLKDEFATTRPGQDESEPGAKPREVQDRREPVGTRTTPSRRVRSSRSTAAKVELSHPDRMFFPEAHLTKRDVFQYYEQVAKRLLPYLKDRPVTLERVPDGLTGPDAPHFWQKDTPAYYPEWIARVSLPTERGKTVHYALVNDRASLLYLVNQAAVTFHVWASRIEDLDRPDFVLFDLDPGKASFADVIAVARAVQKALNAERRPAFVKTTGKAGLHVVTPWSGAGGFDEARSWAGEVARRLVAEIPARATVEIRKARRGPRVYIDVLQNARGHHAVPPYVIRAVPAATVSVPLAWSELRPELDPASFTPETVLRRLGSQKRDPWASFVRRISRSPSHAQM